MPAADEAAEVARIKAAFLALQDPNDWTGDGQPEGWKVIDRVFTKAEARYIPNGAGQTADMAHPTRTGDVVAFSYPPYQFDAATPGTLIARSAFFGQHGYVPDVQDLDSNTNMRATFLAGGKAIERGVVDDVRSIDLAPTAAFLLDIPAPQHSQGVVRRDLLDDGRKYKPLSIVGLNDFHGQLDATTTLDGRPSTSASAAPRGSRRCSTRRPSHSPGRTLLLAAGDNVGASPPNSALLQDMPAIDVENAWGLDATSLGNHEFDFGLERLLAHQDAGELPVPGDERRRGGHRAGAPDWLRRIDGVPRQRHPRRRDRLGGAHDARARAGGRDRRPRVPRRGASGSSASRASSAGAASRSRSWSSTRAPCSAPTASPTAPRPRGRARSWTSSASSRTRRSTS